jgi:uncharacterized membrane protein YgdD (TMEM256/DUF423 family)
MRFWTYCLAALAAFAGAAGVVEAAIAAHAAADPLVQTSANFLLLTAAAVIAIAGIALAAQHYRAWFLAAGFVLLGGAVLFCADLAARVFMTHKLFAYAAPAGGTMMIVGWLAAAIAGLAAAIGSRRTDD